MHRLVLAACAGGHVGYEMAPLIPTLEAAVWGLLSWGAPAKGLNTVAHHDLHHRCPGGRRDASTAPGPLPPRSAGPARVSRSVQRISRRNVHACRAAQCSAALALPVQCRLLVHCPPPPLCSIGVERVHTVSSGCSHCGTGSSALFNAVFGGQTLMQHGE